MIQIHNGVLWDWQYSAEYSSHLVWMWGIFCRILSMFNIQCCFNMFYKFLEWYYVKVFFSFPKDIVGMDPFIPGKNTLCKILKATCKKNIKWDTKFEGLEMLETINVNTDGVLEVVLRINWAYLENIKQVLWNILWIWEFYFVALLKIPLYHLWFVSLQGNRLPSIYLTFVLDEVALWDKSRAWLP